MSQYFDASSLESGFGVEDVNGFGNLPREVEDIVVLLGVDA